MRALFIAAMLVAVPAQAKVWVEETCVMFLETKDDKFIYASTDGGFEIECRVYDWPIKTPVAEMQCSDGSYPTMMLVEDGTVLFNGVHLYPAGHEMVVCD